jgi:hypothetical protein
MTIPAFDHDFKTLMFGDWNLFVFRNKTERPFSLSSGLKVRATQNALRSCNWNPPTIFAFSVSGSNLDLHVVVVRI